MKYASQMGSRTPKSQAYAFAKALVGKPTASNSSSNSVGQPPCTAGSSWLTPQAKLVGKSFPLQNLSKSNGNTSLKQDQIA